MFNRHRYLLMTLTVMAVGVVSYCLLALTPIIAQFFIPVVLVAVFLFLWGKWPSGILDWVIVVIFFVPAAAVVVGITQEMMPILPLFVAVAATVAIHNNLATGKGKHDIRNRNDDNRRG